MYNRAKFHKHRTKKMEDAMKVYEPWMRKNNISIGKSLRNYKSKKEKKSKKSKKRMDSPASSSHTGSESKKVLKFLPAGVSTGSPGVPSNVTSSTAKRKSKSQSLLQPASALSEITVNRNWLVPSHIFHNELRLASSDRYIQGTVTFLHPTGKFCFVAPSDRSKLEDEPPEMKGIFAAARKRAESTKGAVGPPRAAAKPASLPAKIARTASPRNARPKISPSSFPASPAR